MKKFLSMILSLSLVLSLAVSFVACNAAPGEKGEQGEKGEKGEKGEQGPQGEKGDTPTIEISDDGYWVINGEKTDVKANADEGTNENPQQLAFYPTDDGKYVAGIGNAFFLSEVTIPSTYLGCPVVGIVYDGFELEGDKPPYMNLILSDGIEYIEDYAFEDLSFVKSIYISKSVTSIGDEAFHDKITDITVDENNEVYKSIDGNLYSKDGKTLIMYTIGENETSFTIPDTVQRIESGAFSMYAPGFSSIIVPRSVIFNEGIYIGSNNLTIYCEAEEQPETWNENWNSRGHNVVWGYKG